MASNQNYHRFFITLRNTDNKKLTLYYTVNNHSVAKLWQNSIVENFLGANSITDNKPIEKDFSMHGWVTEWDDSHPRNLHTLCEQMNFAINLVNESMVPLGYDYIDLHFTVDKIKGKEYRDLMNDIHHHFEILIGQVWNKSKWFEMASEKARWAICELNTRCHEIEGMVNSITNNKGKAIYLSYNGKNHKKKHPEKKRYELVDTDYLNWKPIIREWGMITCYYSQTGKTHAEVYADKDEKIDKENISAIRYMTGEAILHFSKTPPGSNLVTDYTDFDKWLTENGWDPNDPKLCKGICVIGNIDLEGKSWQDIDSELNTMSDIYEVGFVDKNYSTVVSQVYPVTWQENRQMIMRDL